MKKLFFLMTFFCASSFANAAQTSLDAYLTQMPPAPKTCCGVPDQEKASFRAAVHSVENAMQKDLRERKKSSKDYVEANRSRIEDSMTPQSAQADKPRKSGRLTKEEKKARAEEMRQYGVSPDDRKKLKTMSQEEKTAWALQTSGNASAKMQNDPNVQQLNRQGKAVSEGQPELKAALAQVESREAAIAAIRNKISALDLRAAAARGKNIAPLERELAKFSDIISDAQAVQVKRLDERKRKALMTHCETYSPQYTALLGEYATALRESLPDFKRLDAVTSKTQMIQTDKPVETFAGTDRGMKAIKGYGDALAQVFKYDPAR